MVQHRPASRAVRYRGKLVRLRRVAMAKPMAAPTAEGVIYHILAAAGGGIFSANRVCCTNSFPTHSEWAPGAKQRKPVPRPPQVVYLSAIAHRTRSRAVLNYCVMPQRMHLSAQNRASCPFANFNSPKFVKVFARLFQKAARVQRRVALAVLRRARNPPRRPQTAEFPSSHSADSPHLYVERMFSAMRRLVTQRSMACFSM